MRRTMLIWNKGKNEISVPFGAHDYELLGFEYTIPEGMEAEIKDGKVIARKKNDNDEKPKMDFVERLRHHLSTTPKELYSRTEVNSSKRIPTIEEWSWLINNCKWEWDENLKGQVVTAKNGNSIFLPAAGYRDCTSLNEVGSYGDYWSSSPSAASTHGACSVFFNSGNVDWCDGSRYFGFSVHTVSDTPIEGFVDMGYGLFWAVENEDGYYTYAEAMAVFNDSKSNEITEHELSMLLAVIREPGNAASVSCHMALQSIYRKLTMKSML